MLRRRIRQVAGERHVIVEEVERPLDRVEIRQRWQLAKNALDGGKEGEEHNRRKEGEVHVVRRVVPLPTFTGTTTRLLRGIDKTCGQINARAIDGRRWRPPRRLSYRKKKGGGGAQSTEMQENAWSRLRESRAPERE